MKKQIYPTIKAHLIRTAFYLLLLLGVCAIPFAPAQSRSRGISKQRVAQPTFQKPDSAANIPEAAPPGTVAGKPAGQPQLLPYGTRTLPPSQLPTTSNVGAAPPATNSVAAISPGIPTGDILYDQMDNPAPTPGGVISQDFEVKLTAFDSSAADDFVVANSRSWEITEVDVAGEYIGAGPAESFHVFFYADSGAPLRLPGTLVATRLANPYSGGANAMITLTSPVTLSPGTYWVAVQARQDDDPAGEWLWDNRAVESNSGAAWQNPLGGFSFKCLTWGRKTFCLPQNGPDQLFRLIGHIVGRSPTPTPVPTPTGTPCPGGLLVGSGLSLGYPQNNFTLIASNTVNYTFANSQPRPNDYAIFETHDPWFATVVKSAITGAGHTFDTHIPTELLSLNLSSYRVVVLNWDDHFVSAFITPYTAALPLLEAYVNGGGVPVDPRLHPKLHRRHLSHAFWRSDGLVLQSERLDPRSEQPDDDWSA